MRDLWGRTRTKTKGQIDGFTISPSGAYAAAHKIIDYIEEDDDSLKEGDKPTMMPIYSVVIVDLIKKEILREIKAPKELLHPDKWQQGDVYRFGTGSQLDVAAYYEYNPKTNNVRELQYDHETGKYK